LKKKTSPGIYRHPRFTQDNKGLQENQRSEKTQNQERKAPRRNPVGYSEPVIAPKPATKSNQNSLFNRKRNLKKKLHGIEQLVEKQKSGTTLEKNQIDKISSKNIIEAELEEIEKQISQTTSNF